MLKYLKVILSSASLIMFASSVQAGDVAAGKKVFKKCAACHAVGDGAKNKVGPELNELFGRAAGSLEDYKYSKAMKAKGNEGLVWDEDTLSVYLAAPRKYVKGTKMAFAGLKKEKDLANIIAYLQTFSSSAAEESKAEPTADNKQEAKSESGGKDVGSGFAGERSKGKFGLGRLATAAEVSAWDIDIRPDGKGLPEGAGTVAQGETIFSEQCAACHGDFGEGVDRWPVLAGGRDTLTDQRPVKTIGSYWAHLSTVYDYVRRAMPFGNARSLNNDEYYALTAYLLYLNDIVTDEDFELSRKNFTDVVMPNVDNFIADDRLSEPHYAEKKEPCMSECKPGKVEITMTARVLNVTPDADKDAGGGGID